jgi:hypothetical protein
MKTETFEERFDRAMALAELLGSRNLKALEEFIDDASRGTTDGIRSLNPLAPEGQVAILKGQGRLAAYSTLLSDIEAYVADVKDEAAERAKAEGSGGVV